MLDLFKNYMQERGTVSDEQFELLRPLLISQKVNKGTILLKQGEICDGFAFVAKGCLRSYVRGANGKIHILDFAAENKWIGDYISFFREEGSLFYVDAIEDSHIVLAGMGFYKKMHELFPGFYVKYIQHTHESIRSTQERLVHLLASDGNKRYLDFLSSYPELGLRLPQHMIASYLGVSPESLSRIRHRLSQK